jgi:RND superfamily putative drug exporter
MLRRLATFTYRRRRWVLVLWIVGVIAMTVLAGRVGDDYSDSFQVTGTESSEAQDLLERAFPERAGDSGQLVLRAPGGIDDPAVRARTEATIAELARVQDVGEIVSPYDPAGAQQVAPGGRIAFADIQFTVGAQDVTRAASAKMEEIARVGEEIDGVTFEMGGRQVHNREFGASSELIGLIAAVVILLIAFGSVLAMGLPILTAVLGIAGGIAIVGLLSNITVAPDVTVQLAAMIGLGVGIDYALFIVTRYRQGLDDGLDPERAVVLALDTAGRAVLFAGATVVISLCGLFLMGVDFIRGLGVGAASTVLVMMLASVTLVPALLGFTGRNIDRLSIPGLNRKETSTRESIWFRWSRVVQRWPWTAALVGFAILLVLAVPFLSLHLGFSDNGNNPTTDTSRRAYDALAEGFGPGFNGPLVVAARTPGGPESLAELADALADVPGVAQVGPVVPNAQGDAAVIRVIPTTSPQSEETQDLIQRLRDDVVPSAIDGTGARVLIGGITAASDDVATTLAGRLPIFIGGVLALSFLLLLAVFRSILVPVKAVLMNLLSIGAAYGVVVAVFQWGWLSGPLGIDGTGPIEPFVPMFLFAIVFGLSMDYEVFLLSRIREEYDRSGDNGLAVADGLAATARVITAAAAIMIMVFASFVLGDFRIIKVFGLGLAVAIFIDATIVRILLVPATMELLGKANWWFPKWLRWVPQLHVEADYHLEEELLAMQAKGEDEDKTPVPTG